MRTIRARKARPHVGHVGGCCSGSEGGSSLSLSTFWQSTVRHPGDASGPSGVSFLQEGVDPGDAGPFQDLRVWNLVLPLNMEEFTEADQVEVIELFGVSVVDSPGLASVGESSENHCTVDLQLGGKTESSPLPDVLSESPKGSAGLGNPAVDFCVIVHLSLECAIEAGEVVHCLKVLLHKRS